MRKIVTISLLLIVFQFTHAKQIDEATANAIGQSFLATNIKVPALKNAPKLQLVYKVATKKGNALSAAEIVNFYVFNLQSSTGFIIVSGDDNMSPILGYSFESFFDPEHIPPQVAKWLEGYKKQIQYAVENKVQPDNQIKKKWLALKSRARMQQPANAQSVNPLLQTIWNQSPYYNALCPFDNAANEATVTGCVATAMAQIMKYWNYPANGSGFHSYNHPQYGTLSADFGNTTYQWGSMIANVTGPNSAVATLMYQVGVSVDMNYGIGSAGGSGAYVISDQSPVTNCAEYALKTYFGYKNYLQGVQRVNYSDQQWMNLLKSELNSNRPVLYAGFGNGGGHCFVADGYDNYDFIHFNWGWAGAYDGFFEINALNPNGTGTGGGTGGYNTGHQAVIGIEPPANVQTAEMKLYNYVTPSATTINYGQAFTVSTNIINRGSGNFTGDYCAAVFDNANTLVDYVEIKSNQSLPSGHLYTDDVVFSSAGMERMWPGTYSVGVYYRTVGGNWIALANNEAYTNFAQIIVVYPNDIELNSDITVNSGASLIQGEEASVNVNIINAGQTTFTGLYAASLYNPNDSIPEIINLIAENQGLPSGSTYNLPYLTFNTPAITSKPGTYFMAVLHKPDGGEWQLTGSRYFQNPIKVTVKLPDLQADNYENNDAVEESYTLPINLPGNSATVTTAGSNCHVGTDYDFYKIDLPPGYNYTITARLHDSYSSGNGNTYSLDGLFSYSTDGVNWSGTYDDIMPGTITASGGHTIYFDVAPYFTGTTGTYLLDVQITKAPYEFVWTGTSGTDWSDGSNWSSGVAPAVTDDIIINAGTPYSPVINTGVMARCKSIKVNNGATVTVSTGGNLKIGP